MGTVFVATNRAHLNEIAQRWDRIGPPSPHAARRLFTLVEQTSAEVVRPHVVLIDRPDGGSILAAGRVERRRLPIKAGYRTLFSMPTTSLVLVAGGVVGAHTAEDYDLVLGTLLSALKQGEADILQLAKVEIGGPLQTATNRHVARYRRGQSAPMKHHLSDLSKGFDAFCAARSKNTRWRLRKRLRRLEDPAAHVSVRSISAEDEPAAACRLVDTIAAKSYQRGIGAGFVDDALHRELMAWATADGSYRTWVLYLAGDPVAFVTGLLHNRTFHLFDTAFDPAAAAEEPGSILLARVLQELGDDPDVDAFDYGYGDAQYKQMMSDVEWWEADVFAFARRGVPVALNGVMSGITASTGLAKRLLGAERVARLRRLMREDASSPH